ncbi:hypothetical protein BKA65DRAFT_487502 [Rhexocercosporidium sp. MPI-PUGE-AT-0058]|nr:hypothetical protein BKA65DRAFT_487502 [Rhexocercosporidium sp. MPI-PUGE-AT-0058]
MSKHQTKPRRPNIAMINIPSVKELCGLLGLQNAPDKDADRFQEAALKFVQSHQLPPGMELKNLLKWNDVTVQWELESMAESFLSDGDYGDRFWGAERALYEDGVRSPERSDRIVSILMQIFWRQNKDAFDNLQRGHTRESEPTESTTHFGEKTQRHGVMSRSSTMRTETPDSPTNIQKRKSILVPKPSSASSSRATILADVFDGPDDVDIDIRNAYEFLSKNDTADLPSPPQPEAPSSETNTRKRKAQVDQRRSNRKRVPLNNPNCVPDEVLDELLETSESERAALKESIERDQDCGRETSQENRVSSSGNIETHTAPLTRDSFKAPAAPMVCSSTTSKTPLSKPKVTKPPSPGLKVSGKTSSASNNAPTRKQPSIAGKKILKLNVPSIKAQSKSLGKKLPAALRGRESPNQNIEMSSGSSLASIDSSLPSLPTKTTPPLPPPPPSRNTNAQRILPPPPPLQHPKTSSPETATSALILSPTPSPLPPSLPLPRPRPQIPLWVITYTPRYTEELWDTGRLSNTTLSSFLDSLSVLISRPAESIDKIKLTLRTPLSDTKINIVVEGEGQGEESWVAAMKAFRERLRGLRGRVEGCCILIEPVWEAGMGEEGVGEGEEDIEF